MYQPVTAPDQRYLTEPANLSQARRDA